MLEMSERCDLIRAVSLPTVPTVLRPSALARAMRSSLHLYEDRGSARGEELG